MNTTPHPVSLRYQVILLLSGLLFAPGCARLTVPGTNWLTGSQETAMEIPDRLLPIWTDTVLHQPNQRGVRGFGGRIYFYKEGEDKPVPVDGNLTVYVFDGDYDAVDATRPLKKYIITSEQMKDLSSSSSLGVSYNIWVPWDEVGGASKKLNLIARYDGVQGGTVISASSTKMLPGVDKPDDTYRASKKQDPDSNSFPVSQASYLDEQTAATPAATKTTIFSIDLPSSIERKINVGEATAGNPMEARTQLPGDFIGELPAGNHGPAFIRQGSLPDTSPANDQGVNSINGKATGENFNSSNVRLGKVGSQANVTGQRLRSHFGPRRLPVRKEPATPPESYLLRTSPHPATWQSGLPPTPRSNR